MDEFMGLNPNWGKNTAIVFDSNDQKAGEEYPYFYDCSGFVTWAMINGDKIQVKVINLHLFNSFKDLYDNFDKKYLGYEDDEVANSLDMEH